MKDEVYTGLDRTTQVHQQITNQSIIGHRWILDSSCHWILDPTRPAPNGVFFCVRARAPQYPRSMSDSLCINVHNLLTSTRTATDATPPHGSNHSGRVHYGTESEMTKGYQDMYRRPKPNGRNNCSLSPRRSVEKVHPWPYGRFLCQSGNKFN